MVSLGTVVCEISRLYLRVTCFFKHCVCSSLRDACSCTLHGAQPVVLLGLSGASLRAQQDLGSFAAMVQRRRAENTNGMGLISKQLLGRVRVVVDGWSPSCSLCSWYTCCLCGR